MRVRRLLNCLAIFTAFLTLSSCAGSVFPDPAVATVTNGFSAIQAGSAPVTLDATIKAGRRATGLKWALTLANVNCSPACGTLAPAPSPSLSAVYTPPPAAPLNDTATITVTPLEDRAQPFIFNFTITPAVALNITTKFSALFFGGPAVMLDVAVLNDGGNAGVSWALTAGGANCSPACGTLAFPPPPSVTATYTPPASQPAPPNDAPTITATSVANARATDSFSFSVVSPATLFKGKYALLLRGFDEAGLPLVIGGSVTADGQGNITDGEMDIDGDGGITRVPSPMKGTYSIDVSFNGVARGTFDITNYKFPGNGSGIEMKFVLSGDGQRGKLVEFDRSGYLNAGTLLLQDSAALSAANPAGTYAFGLDSDASNGGRIVEAGQFILGNGGITGGLVDLTEAGGIQYSGFPITAGPSTPPDSSGRGTLTLTVNGNAIQYAYYIVSSKQLNLVEIDAGLTLGTVQSGTARIQNLPFTAGSINMTSVLQMTGVHGVPGTATFAPGVIAGVMKIADAAMFKLTFDENLVGVILKDTVAAGTVFSFDPATGRGVLLAPGAGFDRGFTVSAAFYLSDAGSGYVIDADPTDNIAFSGTITPQSTGPFPASTLIGNAMAMSGATSVSTIPNLAAAVNLGPGGVLAAVGDLVSLNSQVGGLPSFPFSGTYSIVDAALGRGTATLPAFIFGQFVLTPYPSSFYVIGPNQFVLIGTQSGVYSGISVVESQ